MLIHSYYLTPLSSGDEIWAYGFGSNITNGLIPYKDFSMVVGPAFPYFLAFILNVLGKKLIVYHLIIAIMIACITYLSSIKINYYSILIFTTLMIFPNNGYNVFTLLFLFILLTIVNKEPKHKDILIPIIIGIMTLTKQSLILLVIPNLILSRNKRKTIYTYLIISLLFFLYLISFNNLYKFIDYCFLALFEFANKNKSISPTIAIIELLILSILMSILIKTKAKQPDVIFCLAYQIMIIPIFDLSHFIFCLIPFMYIIFQNNKINKLYKNCLFIIGIVFTITSAFTNNELMFIKQKEMFEYNQKNNFMQGRLISKITDNYIENINKIINDHNNHQVYILGTYSYLVKLSLNIPINKFDLINNGNMGYNGAKKYIDEIDKNCANNKCLIFVDERELNVNIHNQTNKEILKYAINNYNKIYTSDMVNAYIN